MSTKFEDDENVVAHNEEQEQKLEPPGMYKVVFVNDDYTPMNFVIRVLEDVFFLNYEAAVKIMLEVHQKGKGVAGVYTFEIAETKQNQALNFAQKNGHPLLIVLEKA